MVTQYLNGNAGSLKAKLRSSPADKNFQHPTDIAERDPDKWWIRIQVSILLIQANISTAWSLPELLTKNFIVGGKLQR